MNCEYMLFANGVVSVEFDFFDTERNRDFVTIKQCTTPSCLVDTYQVAKLSGSNTPLYVTYSSIAYTHPYLQVLFTSDGENVGSGWSAKWTTSAAVHVAELICPNEHTQCSPTNALGGAIASGPNYISGTNIEFLITSNAVIYLRFGFVDIRNFVGLDENSESFGDRVEILKCTTTFCDKSKSIVNGTWELFGNMDRVYQTDWLYPVMQVLFVAPLANSGWRTGLAQTVYKEGWNASWWVDAEPSNCVPCPPGQYWETTFCSACSPLQLRDKDIVSCAYDSGRLCALAARLDCGGSCDCTPTVALSGVIADGPGDYSNDLACEYGLTSNGVVSVQFTNFITQLDVDFVTINQCRTPLCAVDSRQIARLSGSSTLSHVEYSSMFGHPFLQVLFTSDSTQSMDGWSANWTVDAVVNRGTMSCLGTCGSMCKPTNALSGGIETVHTYESRDFGEFERNLNCNFTFSYNAVVNIKLQYISLSDIDNRLSFFKCKTASCDVSKRLLTATGIDLDTRVFQSDFEYPFLIVNFVTVARHTFSYGWKAAWWVNTEPEDCIQCPPGKYWNSASCSDCPVGYFLAPKDNAVRSDCIACHMGTYSAGGPTVECTKCVPGKYSDVLGSNSVDSCKDCPAGKYSDEPGTRWCKDCIAGTYSAVVGSAVSNCTTCTIGPPVSPTTGNIYLTDCIDRRYELTPITAISGECSSFFAVNMSNSNPYLKNSSHTAYPDARRLRGVLYYDTLTFTVRLQNASSGRQYIVTPVVLGSNDNVAHANMEHHISGMACRIDSNSASCALTIPLAAANDLGAIGLRVNVQSAHHCESIPRVRIIAFAVPGTGLACLGENFPQYMNSDKVCTACAGQDVCARGQHLPGCYTNNTHTHLLSSRCKSCGQTYLDYMNLVYTPSPAPLLRQCGLSCASGSMLSGGGCEKCERGKYSTGLDSAQCISCESGKTTNRTGSTQNSDCMVSPCGKGFSYSVDSCEPCPADTYQDKHNTGAQCVSCPSGLSTGGRVRARSLHECMFCKAHHFLQGEASELRCTRCANCSYVNQVHHRLRSCLTCPSMRNPPAEYGGQCSVSIKNKGGCFNAAPVQDIHDCAEEVYTQTGDVPSTMQEACAKNNMYSSGACARVHDFTQLDASYSRQLWQPPDPASQQKSISFNLIDNQAKNDCRSMAQGLKNAGKDFVNVCQLYKTRVVSSPGRFFFIPTTYEAYDINFTQLVDIPNQYRNFECTVCRTMGVPVVNIFEKQDVFPGMKIYSFAEAMPSDAQGYTRYFDFARLGLEYFGTQVINKEYEECKIAFAQSVPNLARCWGLRYRFLTDTSAAGEWKSHNANDYPHQYTNILSILSDVERRVHTRYDVALWVVNATTFDEDNRLRFNFTYMVLRVSGGLAPRSVSASFETLAALPEVWRSGGPDNGTAVVIYNVSHIHTHPGDLRVVVKPNDHVYVQVLLCNADMVCRQAVKYSAAGSGPTDDPRYVYRICSAAAYAQGDRAARLQHGRHFEIMRNSVGMQNVCGLHKIRLDATRQARLLTLASTNTWVQQNLCGRTIDDIKIG